MSNEFMREERYIVFKISDVERYLTDKDRANITMMKMEIDAGRDCANKPPFKGLIVEADWPEYEPTWKAIEARVNGAQNALEESAVQTAARIMNIELIRECDALRAKIAEMEQQEPVGEIVAFGESLHEVSWNRGKLPPLGAKLYALPGAQPSYLPSDLAEAIIADMQAQYDSELITENDSGEALIRLDGAIAAVEDNFAAATEPKP